MVTLLPQTSSMRYYTFMIVICSGVVVHMLSVFCNSMINGILSVTLSFLGSNKNFEIQYHEITNTISTHDYMWLSILCQYIVNLQKEMLYRLYFRQSVKLDYL